MVWAFLESVNKVLFNGLSACYKRIKNNNDNNRTSTQAAIAQINMV